MLLICRHIILMLGILACVGVFAQGIPQGSQAQEADRATTLLTKAIAHYREKGDSAMAAFSRQGEFVDDELYVYVIDTAGVMLASGGPSVNLVGRDVSQALNEELRERFQRALALPEANDIHHADYRWMNWQEGRFERKRVFFQRVDDKIFAVGYYIPRSTEEEALVLLDHVLKAVTDDPADTFERINALDAQFLRDDLYAFVVDRKTERFVAHGYNLRLINSDFRKIRSADQQPIGQQILEAVEAHDKGRINYLWPNPVTRRSEPKVTLFEKTGDYIVAVGFYVNAE